MVSNVEAKPNADLARIVPLLLEQVSAPVRWIECMQEMERAGVTRALELGPGKVLCGLVKRIVTGRPSTPCGEPAGLQELLAALR